MRVWFYGFNKRVNSTKQPPGDTEWSPEVLLKEPVSFYNPVLRVGVQTGANVTRHNYLRIDNVCGVSHAYYFIDNWVSIREDIYECTCTMDLLATYKDYILGTTAYVEYSDSAGNPQIIDKRVNLSNAPSVISGSTSSFTPAPTPNGMIVIYVTGKNSTGFYATPVSSVVDMLKRMTEWGDNLFPGNYEDSFSGIVSMLGDGFRQLMYSGQIGQNITGATWVPWNITGGETELWFGNFQSGFFGRKVSNQLSAGSASLSIPGTGTWLDTSAGTQVSLFLPYAGTVTIPPELCIGRSVDVTYGVQIATGDIAYHVAVGGLTIATVGGSAGVNVPLGIASGGGKTLFNGIVSTATAGASFLAASGAGGMAAFGAALIAGGMFGGDIIGGVVDAAQNMIQPLYSTVGGMGNGAAAALGKNSNISLDYERYSALTDPSILGKPTRTTLSLAGLTGYVQTVGASVAAPTGREQLLAISKMLDGGIYIE